jgi:hypothetical protein
VLSVVACVLSLLKRTSYAERFGIASTKRLIQGSIFQAGQHRHQSRETPD